MVLLVPYSAHAYQWIKPMTVTKAPCLFLILAKSLQSFYLGLSWQPRLITLNNRLAYARLLWRSSPLLLVYHYSVKQSKGCSISGVVWPCPVMCQRVLIIIIKSDLLSIGLLNMCIDLQVLACFRFTANDVTRPVNAIGLSTYKAIHIPEMRQ